MEWPELESTATKTPEWTLRTESELHVERLEAKLQNVKRKKGDGSARRNVTQRPIESMDPDAEEIQAGQEEADEGLWLLWNNNNNKSSASSAPRLGYGGPSHGSGTTPDPPSRSSSEDEMDREERLEQAKARAKHVEDYTANEAFCSSRRCCCIIS
ncbi:hypothetical protein B0O80DRAFT_530771 [Mortierella sp. GBAus27b]|nr:hypothetical protein B0O80DRAFT_530771 [Mortierella sp. GBAus27b]